LGNFKSWLSQLYSKADIGVILFPVMPQSVKSYQKKPYFASEFFDFSFEIHYVLQNSA